MSASPIQMTADGPTVSCVAAGMMRLHKWGMDAPAILDWIKACLDMGVTTFDHADIYGSYTCETRFGQAVAINPGLRDKMQLISKCGIALISKNRKEHQVKHYNTTHDHIIASAEQSLQNLHTDYLDVLLIHRHDPLMEVTEVAEAFTMLKQSGKVRYFGVSNFMPHQFELLQSQLDFPLVTNQVECSVVHMQAMHNGQFDQCQRQGITPMIWSPLAGGSIFNPETEHELQLYNTLVQIGEELGGAGLDCVALAWLMNHPTKPVPVVGTGKLERIQSATVASELEMTRQQWYRIWQASAGHEVP